MPFLEGTEIDGETINMLKINIDVQDVETDEDYAEAYVVITFDDGYGNTDSAEGIMTLVYEEEDNEWYLCADNLM